MHTISVADLAPRAVALRRLALAALALSVSLVLISGAAAHAAPDEVVDGAVVLAVSGEPLGPEPMPRDAEENPARELGGYEDRDVPFTWGAAWLLTFLGLGGLATMGLVYWRSVDRPGRRAPARR